MPPYLSQPLSPPPEPEWHFIQELQAPLWSRHDWVQRQPRDNEACLAAGVRIVPEFDDPEHLLDTAYSDLRAFLRAGNISTAGRYAIQTSRVDMQPQESFRITVANEVCRILAPDTEGIRRGIFHVQDQMLRAGGPFLERGTVQRIPCIRTRISRCFFGPIKRPPRMRDELMDAVDYYPDNYLNRLAHEGVNGIWLTIEFKDLCKTSLAPEYGAQAGKRLAKLQRVVDKCRQYGIQTYIFCIEPRAWLSDDPVLGRYPELGRGGMTYDNRLRFCPFSETAQQYLRESVKSIFAAVPNLGGMINISHGERQTTCLSAMGACDTSGVTCPVCARKQPWEILHASLTPMARGMHEVNPEAELVSWLYMPHAGEPAPWVYDIPAHTPEGIILQFNFETGVRKHEFGKERIGGDYWLSVPGPSNRFTRMAESARAAGTSMSAKIQACCSHEVATVPYVPVPSILYRKFAGMRACGVTATMLSWYFGNYPGIMNKAAGESAFDPFERNEPEFILRLARLYWQEQAPDMARAWEMFAEAYRHFPLTIMFQYYGPMHDGVVWPLLLEPADTPLTPTWRLASPATLKPYPPSGDRIGECLVGNRTGYSLEEAISLCRDLTEQWTRGVKLLQPLKQKFANNRERMLDIGVAEALDIQFRSGRNILCFYDLREKMLRMDGPDRHGLLEDMRAIVLDEIANSEELSRLCANDSRLGFHPEAEGYKYFPARLRWRISELQNLLDRDFPACARIINADKDLFPEYTGRKPVGPTTEARFLPDIGKTWEEPRTGFPAGAGVYSSEAGAGMDHDLRSQTRWCVVHDRQYLYLFAQCCNPVPAANAAVYGSDSITLKLEPRRLWPCQRFTVSSVGDLLQGDSFEARVARQSGCWWCAMRMPLVCIMDDPARLQPIRIDVQRSMSSAEDGRNAFTLSWIPQHPWEPRLHLGSDNPADLGWLVFAQAD